MWLYVPNLSISCPSAPEAVDSISESNWRFPALAQSCSWRGKPSPSRTWYQRWNKVSWLRLLCGAMPEPSTAAAGVDAWTASLAASRASLTALPDGSRGNSTSATSGPMPAASSSSRGRGSSSSKTSAACSRQGLMKSLEPSGYGETFANLVSRLRSDCSRRRKSARAMSASASSSSVWLTPSVEDSARDGSPEAWQEWTEQGRTTQARLRNQVHWSTPRSSDGEKGGPNQAFGAGGTPLPAQAMQWSTPSVADTTGGRMTRSGDRSNEMLLKGQAATLSDQWATPTSLSYGDSHQPGNSRSYNLNMDMARDLYSRLAHPTYQVGQVSSHPRRSLNPLFVEWLMGWPPGWTLDVWIDFACSEMELCRFKQRMRSALSAIALPAEAPPAQLALFG